MNEPMCGLPPEWQEVRMRLRTNNQVLRESMAEIPDSPGVPFYRAVVALNEAACASDRIQLIHLAAALNHVVSLQARAGGEAIFELTRWLRERFPDLSAGEGS
jgi:hypothetical protein